MKLAALYKMYLEGQPLTDAELKAFHAKLSQLVELLFDMGLMDNAFNKASQALRDAHHMEQSRLTSKKK